MAYSTDNNSPTELPTIDEGYATSKYQQQQQQELPYEGDQASTIKSLRRLLCCTIAGWIILFLIAGFAVKGPWQKMDNENSIGSSGRGKSYDDKVHVLQAYWVSAEEQVDSTFLPQPSTTTDTNNLQQRWIHIMNLDRNAVAKTFGNHHRAVVEVPAWWNPTTTINDNDGGPSTRGEDVSPRIVGDGLIADAGLRNGNDTPIVISYDVSTNGIIRLPAEDLVFDSTKDFGLVGKMSSTNDAVYGIECTTNEQNICMVYRLGAAMEGENQGRRFLPTCVDWW